MSRLGCRLVVFVVAVFCSRVRAQEETSRPPAPPVVAGAALTRSERSRLESITALPPDRIDLLLTDPQLHDLATKAIEAHAHRKAVGAATTISGVVLAGGGGMTAFMMLILSMMCWSGNRDCSHYGTIEKGGLVAVGVGVPIFLYGLVRLNWSTSEEQDLLRALSTWHPDARLVPPPDTRAVTDRARTWSLLSIEL